MSKQFDVIGITTDVANVPKILGANQSDEIALFKESSSGKYYAIRYSGCEFETDEQGRIRLVRVVSSQQAKVLEERACAIIESVAKDISNITCKQTALLQSLNQCSNEHKVTLSNISVVPKLNELSLGKTQLMGQTSQISNETKKKCGEAKTISTFKIHKVNQRRN